jgi:hypothetical protein
MKTADEYMREEEERKHWLYTFAGQAMQALGDWQSYRHLPDTTAETAVIMAKALLKELEKE